jgi:hypothetical protein
MLSLDSVIACANLTSDDDEVLRSERSSYARKLVVAGAFEAACIQYILAGNINDAAATISEIGSASALHAACTIILDHLETKVGSVCSCLMYMSSEHDTSSHCTVSPFVISVGTNFTKNAAFLCSADFSISSLSFYAHDTGYSQDQILSFGRRSGPDQPTSSGRLFTHTSCNILRAESSSEVCVLPASDATSSASCPCRK